MRVAVVGVGGVGATLAALLAGAGHDVSLVARGATLAALREHGLRIAGLLGERALRLDASERIRGEPDLVVLAVKMPDLDEAAAIAARDAPRAAVLTPQNGLVAEEIAARHVAPARVVGCVTDVIAAVEGPGRVRIERLGGLVMGPEGAPARAAAGAFAGTPMPARVTSNLPGARWLKLLVNLNNALPAVTNRSVQELYAHPPVAALAARMLREGWQVARAEGARLEPIPTASPALVRVAAALPPHLAGRVLARRVRRIGAGGPILGSTLQSLRAGKPTEVDWLNGEVAKRAARRGLAAPVNAALAEKVHAIEAGAPFWSVAEFAALGRARWGEKHALVGI